MVFAPLVLAVSADGAQSLHLENCAYAYSTQRHITVLATLDGHVV